MGSRFLFFYILLGVCLLLGCQTTYYAVWDKLGKEKRHLLKDNVEEARQEQEKASEEFKDALSRVKEIYGFQGGDLETMYDKLSDDYEDCEYRANAVEERIAQVDRIAADLFEEWEKEIGEITNQKFKADSQRSLTETKRRYTRLNRAMVKAQKQMTPALSRLRDYVLYLKHNLNAQAIGALKEEADGIQVEVQALMGDIAASIKEADEFLKNLE